MVRLLTLALSALALVPAALANGYKDYDNDFVDPAYILAKNFDPSTAAAQQSVIEWADYLSAQGPWSVINKTVTAPTGNPHDYLSWAPYFWPNCTGVGNTTELTPQQIWAECPYYNRDGMFNPDRLLVNNTGDFQAMSDAVFYNAIAWVLTGEANYSENAAHFIDVWFINPATAQTPNLQYAQMDRGPNGQIGTHTGLLDFRQMAKLTSGILILREGNASAWTTELNTQMNNWTTNYLEWMTTSPIAYGEWIADNNHGTYFYNQMASLQILVGDTAAAINTTQTYFKKQYMAQITATGEQPFEAVRTHPYHYRCYNLAAMVTQARIAKYLGMDMWNTPTSAGSTIQTATDFTMTVTLNTTDGDGPIWELYTSIAAVVTAYGDPSGKYVQFLANGDNTYPAEPYFLWNQPLSADNLAAATPTTSSGQPETTANDALRVFSSGLFGGLVAFFSSLILLLG